jgi:SPX domain protein involved in polyphosphate accumulation
LVVAKWRAQVQCIILKHLPVFRTEKGAAAGPGKSVGSGGSDPAEEDLSISAVYLDTDTLEVRLLWSPWVKLIAAR